MKLMVIRLLLICLVLYIPTSHIYAQDSTWQQVLGGWVDDVYYENLFLGGAYYTRISLADIDNDGDLDLFYGGGDCGSLVYFENIGNCYEEEFVLRYEEFPGLNNQSFGLYGGTVDVDFKDLDGDGDLDAAYSAAIDVGGSLAWNDGNAEEPAFVFRQPFGPREGQSNVTLIDIDDDGDYDYFSGHGYRQEQICYSENVGTMESPEFEVRTFNFQDLNFAAPFNFDFGDLDADGDYDLIVCKSGGSISYCENIGTPAEPIFSIINDDYLPDREIIDWTETPELADIDDDGDLDLFLAGGYAHLFLFRNIGNRNDPIFVQDQDTSFFYVFPHVGGAWLGNSVDIDGDGDDDLPPGTSILLNAGETDEIRFSRIDDVLPFVAGAFADMDADGDYDYIVPGGIHTVGYYENIGDTSWPLWNSRRALFPADGRLGYIFTVTVGDLDNDNDIDLLVGHENSTQIEYYRNIGNPFSFDFEYTGSLDLPEWEYQSIFDALLVDIDLDNDLDLFVGEARFDIQTMVRFIYYRNDGTPYEPLWTIVTYDFQNIIAEHRNSGMSMSFADINNDGFKDLLTTNNNIGLQLFMNPGDPTATNDEWSTEAVIDSYCLDVNCFPNPTNATISILIASSIDMHINVEFYNILGRIVDKVYSGDISAGVSSLTRNCTDLSSGIYYIKVITPYHSYIKRITILK